MSLEEAAKACADAAENNLRVAADIADPPPATTGFPSVDNLIGQALQRAQVLLEEGADTMGEAAAALTAQIFQNETEPT